MNEKELKLVNIILQKTNEQKIDWQVVYSAHYIWRFKMPLRVRKPIKFIAQTNGLSLRYDVEPQTLSVTEKKKTVLSNVVCPDLYYAIHNPRLQRLDSAIEAVENL